jgi:hypothetical protein
LNRKGRKGRQGNQCQGEPGCNHQIGDLDDKACTLFSFASFASFAVQDWVTSDDVRRPAAAGKRDDQTKRAVRILRAGNDARRRQRRCE